MDIRRERWFTNFSGFGRQVVVVTRDISNMLSTFGWRKFCWCCISVREKGMLRSFFFPTTGGTTTRVTLVVTTMTREQSRIDCVLYQTHHPSAATNPTRI